MYYCAPIHVCVCVCTILHMRLPVSGVHVCLQLVCILMCWYNNNY